ncbi:MAG: phosphate acetyltransferase [Acidimicrobiales bacterium]|nr:phosphate acetyltransferase [Acidimicrobiales bacterium]
MGPGGARSIYLTAPEGRTGKSVVALGLVELLTRRVQTVGVFRPVTHTEPGADQFLDLLLESEGIEFERSRCIGVDYDAVHADPEAALSSIVERYRALAAECDVVVVIGSDFTDVTAPIELEFNGRVAANLGAPVLMVVSGLERTPEEITRLTAIAVNELAGSHAATVAVVANRCDPGSLEEVKERLSLTGLPAWAVPEVALLSAPTVGAVVEALDGTLVHGDEQLLSREAEDVLVCGMTVDHVLDKLDDGQLCMTPGDRADVLVALAGAHGTKSFPSLAGVVLVGGYRPGPATDRLVATLASHLPVAVTDHDSFRSARIASNTRGLLGPGMPRKKERALAAFETHIDGDDLLAVLEVPRSTVVTPLMFESMLLERARADKRHIVLPEGDDERVLQAAATLLAREVVDITFLGVESEVRSKAAALGLDLAGAAVIDPRTSDLVDGFAEEYARLREHRGVTVDAARDYVSDVSYFGTLMVHAGLVDGMVSGAAHSTAHTITPSFQIIKTAPGIDVVSSVFLMCLPDRVLVYGDCAVIPEPTVEELADIAISSSATAEQFGVDPRVAMLSYSTGESGRGAEVERVRSATALVRERRPDLSVDGPIQYDAAVDAAVAAAKLPGSAVAGRATVFVFPDLNTGNNTYKAVQRSAGAVAIGPVLQGLAKPVNDLSRGATVRDIVNTVAITAIQAQALTGGGGSES